MEEDDFQVPLSCLSAGALPSAEKKSGRKIKSRSQPQLSQIPIVKKSKSASASFPSLAKGKENIPPSFSVKHCNNPPTAASFRRTFDKQSESDIQSDLEGTSWMMSADLQSHDAGSPSVSGDTKSGRKSKSRSQPQSPLKPIVKKSKPSSPSPSPAKGKENKPPSCSRYHCNNPSSVVAFRQTFDEQSESDIQINLGGTSRMYLRNHDVGSPSNSPEPTILTLTEEDCSGYAVEIAAGGEFDIFDEGDDEPIGTQLDLLTRLCENEDDLSPRRCDGLAINCPLCGLDMSHWDNDSKQFHTNSCLDNSDGGQNPENAYDHDTRLKNPLQAFPNQSPQPGGYVIPVLEWLQSLGLAKYQSAFIQQKIGWDNIQCLNEEDLISIGITALGPRKKILHALNELKKPETYSVMAETNYSEPTAQNTKKPAMNRLITEFFPSPGITRKQDITSKDGPNSGQKPVFSRKVAPSRKSGVIPSWCCISGTPFRVDAFRYLRRDCFHWFLTHFHIDHYQGLTRSFSHGKIYCSMITARLVNMKIGIPWDKLQVLPLNQKINIGGVHVTCFDANHCPGAVIILFEPPNGKVVLHTGDFRFSEEMASLVAAITCPIHTLILDTTYCDNQYDFPKQEAVVQFVIDAIQAESFNPNTLFLIGSYTIGKEKLFLEVARALRKKVFVTAAKLRLLECLELNEEDLQWFTTNEVESHIHVVPMWALASFKRLTELSHKYADRFSLFVSFSPTGWSLGKDKKKSAAGRRWKKGTIIRYEVPYSEHCSFTELKEFVQLVSPSNIIPSVNNDGEQSSRDMVARLLS